MTIRGDGPSAPEPAQSPDRTIETARLQRRTLAVLIAAQVLGMVGVGAAPSIGVLLVDEVTSHEALAGLARTSSTLGAALIGVPLGTLAARRGRRIALTTGWWTAATGALILVAAAQWSLIVPLFLGLLMIGAGSATGLQARFAATDLAAPQHAGRSLATVVWVGTLGSVIGPNLGTPGRVVGEATGLHVFAAAFLIAAAGLSLAGLVVLTALRPDPLLLRQASADAPPAEARPRRRRLGPALTLARTDPAIRYALLAILTAQIVMVAVMTMTPVHLSHHGGSIEIIGLTISLHVAGMYVLAPIVGTMADRRGARSAIIVGLVILTLSLLVAAILPETTGGIITALVLLGIGWCFVNVAASALFSALVPTDVRASAQGGVDALSNLGAAAAAFASGPLMALTGFPALALISLAIMVPLALATLRPPQGIDQERAGTA